MSAMDGTQSSSDSEAIMKNEMSYLYGRDPSILAYGQRPFPSQESKKNLYSLLEDDQDEKESISRDTMSTTTADKPVKQTIQVFLRMKPFPQKMKLTEEQKEAYTIVDSTTLLTKMPSLDNNASCLKKIRHNEVVCRNFMFTQTFDEHTSQLELFEQAVKPQMVDFLAGKNSIVMSYGTTNSGKTYTLQGTPESPGLIPRGIEYVFCNIDPRGLPPYKPVNLCDVIYLNSQERAQELETKIKLLALNPADKNSYATTYNRMQQMLHKESPMRSNQNNNAQYSVWISFAEIYNETIYDLLWNDCQKKRPALKLAADSKGRTYIKGLKSVCVNSGAEAYQVLMAGQYNLKVAATALNSRSSRSHCIFTIKLLKYTNEFDTQSVNVSMFAFCDLAGSERLKKTLNVGERLKEAQNINTSLLVLGRCLKTIYETQSTRQKNESIGPFRESKLTRLFQRALSGKEQIALIVNVNPVPNLYIETQNVLNFSAIAKKIVIERVAVKRRRSLSRFSRLVTQSMKSETDWENTELNDVSEMGEEELESDIDEHDEEEYADLIAENEMLRKENKELKASVMTREIQTRKELTDMYTRIMNELEADWKNRLTDMEEQQEDMRDMAVERIERYYKNKLNQLSTRKRSRSSTCDTEDDFEDKLELEELEAENTKLMTKIETLKKCIRDIKQSKETIESEKTKISFELTVAKEEAKRANEMLALAKESLCAGDDAVADYVDQLLEKLKAKDERINTMKTFLNDAKEEYISITDQCRKFENQVKEQEELLAVNTEHIQDLELQLSQANAYSSEQSKLIENLEEELDQQSKRLIEAEEKARNLENKSFAASLTDEEKQDNSKDNESEKTKQLLQEMKLRLEFAEKTNEQLQDKLTARIVEVESLKSNLDMTKNQLDRVTEKVSKMNINEAKQESCDSIEQGIQTKIDNSLKDLPTTNESCIKLIDFTCSTNDIFNESVKTDEKWQQTSFCLLNESQNKDKLLQDKQEIINEKELIIKEKEKIINEKDVIIESNKQALSDLEKQYQEIKDILEMYKIEKNEAQKHFDDQLMELKSQISKLSVQVEEKNEKIITMQNELEEVLEKAQKDARRVEELSEVQDSKCKALMDRIEEAQQREEDKDKEISNLQQEMKALIRSKEESLQKMESESKTVLQELITIKDQLSNTEERNFNMDKDYRQTIHLLELKLQSFEQKAVENESLRVRVDDLKKALTDSEQEFETFKKNRDETVLKYENLVKTLTDELERIKKENKQYHDLIQEVKENTIVSQASKSARKPRRKATKTVEIIDNTSEDDHVDDSQISKTSSKQKFLTPSVDNFTIELSGSETKKSCINTSEQTAPTRVTRRKKLFTQVDESFVEIDQTEPSPSTNRTARNLRNRRK